MAVMNEPEISGLEKQKTHEAIELAKLAVQMWGFQMEGYGKPDEYLEPALELVHKASEVIKKSRE